MSTITRYCPGCLRPAHARPGVFTRKLKCGGCGTAGLFIEQEARDRLEEERAAQDASARERQATAEAAKAAAPPPAETIAMLPPLMRLATLPLWISAVACIGGGGAIMIITLAYVAYDFMHPRALFFSAIVGGMAIALGICFFYLRRLFVAICEAIRDMADRVYGQDTA